MTTSDIVLRWEGPFRWPGRDFQGEGKSLNDATVALNCGVYLWTVEHCDGYLIYTAGITRRSFVKRLREHTRAYLTGVYTIFDVPSLRTGIRKEIWPGFWFKRKTVDRQHEYENRFGEIHIAAKELLANYRVFVAPIDPRPRLLERIEAAIMNVLYIAPGPASRIPDRGMALAPRWHDEQPILVHNTTSVLLYGLPSEFEA